MKHLVFAKYQGAGNDFIVIDDRKLRFPVTEAEYIAHLCHRRLGIGADGVILLQPSKDADFRMRIFNADGKEAAQCGNGLRCLVDYIRNTLEGASPLSIETQDRITSCSWKDDIITVDLGSYTWMHQDIVRPPFSMDLIHTGVPHAVVFVESINRPDFKEVASSLRAPSEFAPEGANVNFVELRKDVLWTRVYERGVEDETLACGTGAAAVAIAAKKKYHLKNPVCVMPLSEEALWVEINPSSLRLSGRATCVFQGVVLHW